MAVRTRQPQYQIAPMRPVDLEQVVEIEQVSFRSPWSRQVFIEELERDWAHVDVLRARAGGPCLAFVNYWLVRDEVHILNLATSPDRRRCGLASQLLAHVIDVGRRGRCKHVTLEVRRSNGPAIELYRKFAFRPVGYRPNYYAEDREDALVMMLELE